jgi:hypothetical protein
MSGYLRCVMKRNSVWVVSKFGHDKKVCSVDWGNVYSGVSGTERGLSPRGPCTSEMKRRPGHEQAF